MKFKMLKIFAWFLLTVVLLFGVDQLLVRVPFELPGVKQAQTFYVDFRGRLLGLFGIDRVARKPDQSIEQVIESSRRPVPNSAAQPQRYLYVDDSGALQFADSLQQVPVKYRDQAEPLAE